MRKTTTPTLSIGENLSIPQLGFGVWQIGEERVADLVSVAFQAGYRLIDTAQGYDNEGGVGRAVRGAALDRSEIFVTSKLRTRAMSRDDALAGVTQSLDLMGLGYLDLMLIHWPTPAYDQYVETWKGLINAKQEGLVRAIGVSNFTAGQLERIIEATGIAPALCQIETHPYFQQREMMAVLADRGIAHEAYSPLGNGGVLDDPVIGEIARALGRSPAQVIIRWHLQRGSIVIPKSATPARIRENFEVFDLALDDEEMRRIDGLDRPDGRTCGDPETFNDLY